MSTLSEIITVMQTIVLLSFAVRFVMCCIHLAHNADEKPQIIQKMKHILIAAILVVVVFSIKALVEYYYYR